ncbi:MAG TPA: glycoside hydrolase family 28 protein [Prolixibacteraceae bacterium]|nr:glycoside hydrolase family 28 protein [Prolixibacteraceae bacterium]
MIRKFQYLLIFVVLTLSSFAQSGNFYNVKDYGAKGDGKTIDNKAIDAAIIAASEKGGGTVFFPAGTYLSFTIHLKSFITLHLDNGAVLEAADVKKYGLEYDPAEPNSWDMYQDFGHSHWRNSLIYGENLQNIAITGLGTIFGNGLTREGFKTPGMANKAIALKLCRNVVIKDLSILMGGHFAILATGVDNLTIDNLKVDTNRDAFDIDCCRHVRISNCSVNSPYDDAICLKSSFALGFARATEDVTITNCAVSGFDRTTFLNGTYQKDEANTVPDKGVVTGRIKFGTESNGGFRNITITNCTFEFCRGLALETVDGGILEDVTVDNIVMKDVQNAPFFLRLGARMRGPEGTPVGVIRRINISNVVAYSENQKFCSMIVGIPGHPIEDVKLSNIFIRIKGGAPKEQALLEVGEHEKSYPDPQEFGDMPAYGFFIRHVRNIELNHVELKLENDDFRPAFILEDVTGASLNNVTVSKTGSVPSLVLKNVEDIRIKDCRPFKDKRIKKTERTQL